MFGDRHTLENEFPEKIEQIAHLRAINPEFSALYQTYDQLDQEIWNIEEQIENTSDDHLETLKKKRLDLKDQLFGMLQENT